MKRKLLLILVLVLFMCGCESKLEELPLPETESGQRGELGIDKNINEKTLDNYLNRDDIVYRDVRMLKDDADYEAIGGDSYLSGFVNGFEIVPYPYLAPTIGLPDAVGKPYSGKTLFTIDEKGNYKAQYEESLEIMEYLFPKDKKIFLMCGGGGYAGMTKKLLISLGWDKNNIYDVGGYWYYEGNNKIEVKNENKDKTISYDFWKIPYHNIDFTTLHEAK